MLLLLLGAIALVGCAGHPTDEQLEEWFFSHKKELTELRDMLIEDVAVQSVTLKSVNYWPDTPPAEPISPDRVGRYRAARQEKCRHLDGNWYLMLVRNNI